MMAPMCALLMTSMDSLLMKPIASSLINALTGKEVTRARKRQEIEILPLQLHYL